VHTVSFHNNRCSGINIILSKFCFQFIFQRFKLCEYFYFDLFIQTRIYFFRMLSRSHCKSRVCINSLKYKLLLFNRCSKPLSLKNNALPFIIIHHGNHEKKNIGIPTWFLISYFFLFVWAISLLYSAFIAYSSSQITC